MTLDPPAESHPRVCLCVLMNHPFPDNIPLLRRIYGERFSYIRFLIPFERSDDADVLTVYRGSYTHAAYLTDARAALALVDCDYFLVTHDDVLLNPRIEESSFAEYFPIGPNDAFIPAVFAPGLEIGSWSWWFGLLPKLYHPKSLLFGSGVESDTLWKYLPPAELVSEKLWASSLPSRSQAALSQAGFGDVAVQPSLVLLHGLAARIEPGATATELSAACLDIERRLVKVMLAAAKMEAEARGLPAIEGDVISLPIPLATSGFYADLYVLPKSKLDDYAHYMGVAAAANLFVEVMTPTLLATCCDRLWTSRDFGLDVSGFLEGEQPLSRLADPKLLALHPVKLSKYADSESQAELMEAMETIRGGAYAGPGAATPGNHSLGRGGPASIVMGRGWHTAEPWGRWAAQTSATLRFTSPPNGELTGVRLTFLAPVHASLPALSGRVRLNGREATLSALFPEMAVRVEFGADALAESVNEIELISDQLVRPLDLDPMTHDPRQLGFGVSSIELF